MDRLDTWRIFVSVARHASFARAAEQHRCSPQAVTRAVAELEDRLGTRLLHRTTRAVSLTDDGARYLERARRLLADVEQLEAPVDRDAPLRGLLSVTGPVLFGQLHVLPVVSDFLALHPAVDVRLLLLDRVVSLADEGLDVGVRLGALADSSLRARRVGQVRSVLVASPAYLREHGAPRTVDALARHSCIAFTATTPVANRWSFPAQGARERRVTVRPRLTVNTGQAAIDAALAGLGIARVLSYQVAELVAEKRLKRVLESVESDPVPVQLVHLEGTPSRATSAFLDFAAAKLGQRLAKQT